MRAEASMQWDGFTMLACARIKSRVQLRWCASGPLALQNFRCDAETLMIAMEENAVKDPNKVLEIQRALQDENFVAVHSHIKQKPDDRGIATVHIFRFQEDAIVELWDIGQPVPEDSPNSTGCFGSEKRLIR